jgi:nitrogen regulatory protein P-II 1
MMLITAIVVPSRVDVVRHALTLFDVRGLTRTAVFTEPGVGGPVEVYRGVRWSPPLTPRVRLDVLSANDDAADLVRVISRAVTGSDLVLWVTRVDLVVRIRTGEVGLDAI